MDVQLRTLDGDLRIVASVNEAFEAAKADRSIWKISWSEGEDRIRLVCGGWVNDEPCWVYDPMKTYIEEALGPLHKAMLRHLSSSETDSPEDVTDDMKDIADWDEIVRGRWK